MKKEFHDSHQGRNRSLGQLMAYALLAPGLCCFTTANYALTGGAQQAIQALPESSTSAQPATVLPPEKQSETTPERAKRIKEWLATPAGQRALENSAKHPYLTYTAPSVFTPAGVPMKWGGIGFAASGFGGDGVIPQGANVGGGGGIDYTNLAVLNGLQAILPSPVLSCSVIIG